MALGIGYVTDRARVLPDLHGNVSRPFRPFAFEDEASFAPWLGDLEPMTHIDHPMLPVVFDGIHSQHLLNGDMTAEPVFKRDLGTGRRRSSNVGAKRSSVSDNSDVQQRARSSVVSADGLDERPQSEAGFPSTGTAALTSIDDTDDESPITVRRTMKRARRKEKQ